MVVLLLAVACGGASDEVQWRGLDLTLPEGWVVVENRSNVLTVADAPRPQSPGALGDRTVSVQVLHDSGADVEVWRDSVRERDGTVEVDEETSVGGRPARRLVFTRESNDVTTREMVVLVPSRELEILLQPVARPDEHDLTQVFLDHRDEFDELLASVTFGAPAEGP